MRFKPFSRSPSAPTRSRRRAPGSPTYRFTIVSVSATLNALRKQLYYELQALDLRVLNVRISREESDQLASTRHPALPAAVAWRAQRRRAAAGPEPDVRRVHWENDAGAAIAVLPA